MPSDRAADRGSARVSGSDLRAASASTLRIASSRARRSLVISASQERGLVGEQLRDGFARSLVNRPCSRGAPVKPFYGAGDERIVVVHF